MNLVLNQGLWRKELSLYVGHKLESHSTRGVQSLGKLDPCLISLAHKRTHFVHGKGAQIVGQNFFFNLHIYEQ